MFNQLEYNKWDDWGKSVLINWLSNKGHTMVHNPDRYGIDLYSDLNGKLYLWEVEVCTWIEWNTKESYPYESVSFLGRKIKWNDWNFFYCIICAKTEAIIICESSVIFNDNYKTQRYVKTRNCYETFYMVPKHLCKYINAQTG